MVLLEHFQLKKLFQFCVVLDRSAEDSNCSMDVTVPDVFTVVFLLNNSLQLIELAGKTHMVK